MNANAVLDMIGDAKDTYIWDAQQVRSGNVTYNKKKISIKKMWLIAAIIAMILTLVGCTIVYVLSLQDFEIGSQTTTKEVWSDDGRELLGEETIPQQVFTLNGLKGTASYQASKEWFEGVYETGNNVDGKTWWDVYVMEPRHMEAVADAIDFDMQPNIDFSLALKEQARLNALWETMN